MIILISRKDIKDTRSGVPRNILRQIEFFTAKGHSVYVIAERIDSEMISSAGGKPVKTLRLPISGYFRRKFYQYQSLLWIKQHCPELIISHGDIETQDVLCMHNCTHLAHERIFSKPLPDNNEAGKIHRDILTNARFKLLICNSHLMRNDFIDRFGINSDKAEVIYQEVKTSDFNSDEYFLLRSEMRASYKITSDKRIIGLITSGNFKKRNVATLIDAFAILSAEFSDIVLFIAGADNSSPYIAQARKLGIGEKTIFAPSIMEVKRYYYMIDIFVLPALIEEFGKSVLEAMYCKKPVIVSKYTGSAEIIESLSRNFILEKNDSNDIAEKLSMLLKSGELMEKVAAVNYNTSLKYTSDKLSEQFYLTLIKHDLL
ncbi:MAG: glycosyltransferase family 4 protein [Deferribacteraceae bacterium]|jgi:UDP-glucose:(heptosyl)LPS alpha-1,3-glucosyltransferase|nr:glycosyltransferase family 4 protein [Deferribacteraceae bacterium]